MLHKRCITPPRTNERVPVSCISSVAQFPPTPMLRIVCSLALIAVFCPRAATAATPDACLHYRPDTVTITGALSRRTFFGAPGFGEDPAHDAKETGFYLDLPHAICTLRGRDADADDAKTGVRRVQLVLDSAGFARLRPFLGKSITLRGTLFGEFTGHHHAPLLLDVLKTPAASPVSLEYRWVGGGVAGPVHDAPFPARGEMLAVSDSIVLDLAGVASAHVMIHHDVDTEVFVRLTPAAAQAFAVATAAHIGATLAVLLDGQVVQLATIHSRLGAAAGVVTGVPRDSAEAIAARINRARATPSTH